MKNHLDKSPFSRCTNKPCCVFKGKKNYDNCINVFESQVENAVREIYSLV